MDCTLASLHGLTPLPLQGLQCIAHCCNPLQIARWAAEEFGIDHRSERESHQKETFNS